MIFVDNLVLDVLNNAIQNAEKNAIVNSEDYKNSEGLLMCGKCHTPKQINLNAKISSENPFYWRIKNKPVFVMCKCESERLEKEKAMQKQKDIKLLIKKLRSQGITDDSYLSYTFKNDDKKRPDLTVACKRYAENFNDMYKSNRGLMFCGQVGTGKTFYACCIANEVLSQAKSVLITTLPNLISKMAFSKEEKNYIENQISYVSLLVIDDFGIERNTSYALEQITEIINRRYIAKKPLIITTNLKYKEMKNCQNITYKRIYDKIIQLCYPIAIIGESRRAEESEKSNKFMGEFLGLNQTF